MFRNFEGEKELKVLKTGTTTVGLRLNDAVVLATDRRVTSGYFIAHKIGKKIWKIDEHIAATMSGSVADVQKLLDRLTYEARLYRIEHGRPATVKRIASLSSAIMFSARPFILIAHIIIGGVDDEEGPQLYMVDWYGTVTREDSFIATGSGSPIAVGVLEDGYREDMSLAEAVDLAIRAVHSAMKRDPGSGEGVDVAVVKEGVGYIEFPRSFLDRLAKVKDRRRAIEEYLEKILKH